MYRRGETRGKIIMKDKERNNSVFSYISLEISKNNIQLIFKLLILNGLYGLLLIEIICKYALKE